MTEADDGIEEAIVQSFVAARSAAERTRQLLARVRAVRDSRDEPASRRQEAGARYEAAREKAHERLSPADDPRWRNEAPFEEVIGVYTHAETWRYDSPEVEDKRRVLRGVILDRYDYDVDASLPEEMPSAPERPALDEGPAKRGLPSVDGPHSPLPSADAGGTRDPHVEGTADLRENQVDPKALEANYLAGRMNAHSPRLALESRPAAGDRTGQQPQPAPSRMADQGVGR